MSKKNLIKRLQNSEPKERHKAYKSNKSWVYATITSFFGAFGGAVAVPMIVHADNANQNTTKEVSNNDILAVQNNVKIPADDTRQAANFEGYTMLHTLDDGSGHTVQVGIKTSDIVKTKFGNYAKYGAHARIYSPTGINERVSYQATLANGHFATDIDIPGTTTSMTAGQTVDFLLEGPNGNNTGIFYIDLNQDKYYHTAYIYGPGIHSHAISSDSESTSDSISGSISDSISGSISDSISESGSDLTSNSISGSESISDSTSDSISGSDSTSDSISGSDSTSDLISGSDSTSDSISDSISDSNSTSGSLSDSISGSDSIFDSLSDSISDSDSLSDSISDSDSTSDVISDSESTSDSISGSDSMSDSMSDSNSTSDVISDSESTSDSISESMSNSESGSESTSESMSNSESGSESTS
ncbi:KxYKxGKxW signal peptide domain-containing protein, partial [Weissella oryzae]|uniref:KxYKxGKxW signal peptide domain-containing protein n=1 Tax=Weissella oryzae TaxID=1129792 RepID=UPI0016802712